MPRLKAGFLYIMRTADKIVSQGTLRAWKIGIAEDVGNRLRQLRSEWVKGAGLGIFACVYMGDPGKLERELHKRYARRRVMREWFALDTIPESELLAALGPCVCECGADESPRELMNRAMAAYAAQSEAEQ